MERDKELEHLKSLMLKLEATLITISNDYRELALKVNELKSINKNLKNINEELVLMLEEEWQ